MKQLEQIQEKLNEKVVPTRNRKKWTPPNSVVLDVRKSFSGEWGFTDEGNEYCEIPEECLKS